MGDHKKAKTTNISTKQTSKGVSASLLLATASLLGTSVGAPAAVPDGSVPDGSRGLATNNAADLKSFVSIDSARQHRVAVQRVAVNVKVTTPTIHTQQLAQPKMKSTVKTPQRGTGANSYK